MGQESSISRKQGKKTKSYMRDRSDLRVIPVERQELVDSLMSCVYCRKPANKIRARLLIDTDDGTGIWGKKVVSAGNRVKRQRAICVIEATCGSFLLNVRS